MLMDKSGLNFDKVKDYDVLCDKICLSTNRSIGVNTIKRLMGYLDDTRKTNVYTLNTIALYLGFETWEELCGSIRIDSDWNYIDETIYIDELPINSEITIKYLNRVVKFKVIVFKEKCMLQVLESLNSSLQKGDILEIEHIREGKVLEAKVVYRGERLGNYKTNGEITHVEMVLPD